ncbi:hypothetical protein MHYP_G00184040 [Metynnis hypsauchen]
MSAVGASLTMEKCDTLAKTCTCGNKILSMDTNSVTSCLRLLHAYPVLASSDDKELQFNLPRKQMPPTGGTTADVCSGWDPSTSILQPIVGTKPKYPELL